MARAGGSRWPRSPAVARNKALLLANANERSAREQAQRRFGLAREAVEQYSTGASQDVLLMQPEMESLREAPAPHGPVVLQAVASGHRGGARRPQAAARLATVYRQVAQIAVEVGSRRVGLEALESGPGRSSRTWWGPTRPHAGPRRDLASCLDFIGRLEVYTSGQESEGLRSLERLAGAVRGTGRRAPRRRRRPLRGRLAAGRIGLNGRVPARSPRGSGRWIGSGTSWNGCWPSIPINVLYRNQLALSYGEPRQIQALAGQLPEALRSQGRPSPTSNGWWSITPRPRSTAGGWARSRPIRGRVLSEAGRPSRGACPTSSGACRSSRRWRPNCPPSRAISGRSPRLATTWRAAQARLGRREEALRSLARGAGDPDPLIADHPDFIAYQADLAENYLWTGVVYQDSGRPDEARVELSNARELAPTDDPGHRQPRRRGSRRVPARPRPPGPGRSVRRPIGRWRPCGGPSLAATGPPTPPHRPLLRPPAIAPRLPGCSCSTSPSRIPRSPREPGGGWAIASRSRRQGEVEKNPRFAVFLFEIRRRGPAGYGLEGVTTMTDLLAGTQVLIDRARGVMGPPASNSWIVTGAT